MSTSGSTGGSPPERSSSERGSPEDLHRFVRDLAQRTGELQLSRYGRPGEIREKAPKDLVTEVDLLCEEFLVNEIQANYPNDAILSEEKGGELADTGRTWLLDPVDGTANFAHDNPLFCACISVVEGGQVRHAAIAAPRLGDVYYASSGGGAFRDSNGETYPLRVGEARRLEDSFVGVDVALRFLDPGDDPVRRGILKVFHSSWQLRSLGSAGIRGAWHAAGYIDVSLGTRNTLWDYAPTSLLVPEAGGRVTDLSGNPWTFDADGLVSTNNDALHEEVLNLIASG